MARRNAYLRKSFHEKGLDAVRHAHQQFDQLSSLPPVNRIKAAKDLPEIFTEAMVIEINGNPQMARDCLRSHFYINEVISLNDLVTQARRKRFSQLFARITLFAPRKIVPSNAVFKGISKPIEAQSLSVEMDLMLNTIRAAHAPTAAKERSSLHPLSI